MFRPPYPLLMALVAVSTVPVHLAGQSTESGRPLVLVMHGRGVQGQDTTLLRERWWRSLDQGLSEMTNGAFLREDDLRVVWYSEALRPERAALCETRARPDGRSGSGASFEDVMAAAGNLLAMAGDLVAGPEGVELRSVAGDLLYLGDDVRRCAAEEQLAKALARARSEGRPVILIAHSFGSLVSYRYLKTRDPASGPTIERYLTVGSLIGQPELRSLLLGYPIGNGSQGSAGTEIPLGVGSWVNVRDPADPFASPLIALESHPDTPVFDLRTDRPTTGDPHDLGRYLADPVTARAVLDAWCSVRKDPAPPCLTQPRS